MIVLHGDHRVGELVAVEITLENAVDAPRAPVERLTLGERAPDRLGTASGEQRDDDPEPGSSQ
jgi:hypothetical protein